MSFRLTVLGFTNRTERIAKGGCPEGQAAYAAQRKADVYQLWNHHIDNMSEQTYNSSMSPDDKPLVWLHGEIKTPPLSEDTRIEAGFLLRRLQRGETLALPHVRPMPAIGARCYELRINDENQTWRIMYRIDADAVVILEVFSKKSRATPKHIIQTCQRRLKEYDY